MQLEVKDPQVSVKAKNKLLNAPTTEELELIDYLRMIWRWKKLILLGTVIPMMVVGVISFIQPPVYETTAQIRIGRVWEKDIENPYLTSELINSDALLAKVIEKLNLPTTPSQMKTGKNIEVQVLEGGIGAQRLPLLLNIRVRARNPKEAIDISNILTNQLIEEHKLRFEEKLKEYKAYEQELGKEVERIDEQINDLEKLIKKQSLNPIVNAPSVILLQAQLEQKSVQLLSFKKELKDTRINNTSSIVTESTKLVSPPVLPKNHVPRRTQLNMMVAGALGLFMTLVLGFFLEYLARVRLRELNNIS